jgi:hypothetical protein
VSVVPADWDFATAKAYALADNRTAELADWDTSVLASQLIELDAVGWDIKDLGFESLQPPSNADFSPSDEEQPRLDQRSPITCPNCLSELRVGANNKIELVP